MRIRLNPKGDILHDTKQLFDLVSAEKFIEARNTIESLRSSLVQYYVSRGMDRGNITGQLYTLKNILNADQRIFRLANKKEVAFDKLEEILKSIATEDLKKIPSNKYDRLMQIYEDIQDDLEQFGRSRRYEDSESIRGDFADIRDLEPRFMTDAAEYLIYQDLIKQIGLCNGVLVRASFGEKTGPDMKKIYVTFENLFPKLESLIASKKFRAKPKEKEEELSDTKIKEIGDLAEHQKMNVEEIANFTGLSQDVVESVLFPE